MLFFLTLNKNEDVSFSLLREWDKQDFGVSYLRTPLPLAVIEGIRDQLKRRTLFDFWDLGKSKTTQQRIDKLLKAIFRDSLELNWAEFNPGPLRHQGQLESRLEEKSKPDITIRFSELVLGRQLSSRDLRGLAQELKVTEEKVIELAHNNVVLGRAQWVPSVKQKASSGWQCLRCGQEDVEEWPSFYGMAATCRSCESIGVSTSIEVLYRDQRSLMENPQEVKFEPHWDLTEAQRLASEQVLDFMHGSEERALLWAACGAGKTEVCFPSAAWALEQGKSMLFAAPRQDVIHDVLPRLQRDFPGYPIQILTGAIPVKFQAGGLVLATTHQVLRFWQAFDFIFMDEMDAFPYLGSEALAWGLKHALRQGGKILYLTATPSPEGLKLVQQGTMRLIELPARHHRNPLPIPVWQKSRHSLDPNENECREEWTEQIRAIRREGPVLIFVPKIAWVAPWIQAFRQHFPDWQIDGSYSSDSGRAQKVNRLIQGEFDLFLSTTILERGITLSRIQVVVLASDHPIFDERALVQMAGRVGRTRECPGGRIVFISKQCSPAMKTAIQWIEAQNSRAMELGLLETAQRREEA